MVAIGKRFRFADRGQSEDAWAVRAGQLLLSLNKLNGDGAVPAHNANLEERSPKWVRWASVNSASRQWRLYATRASKSASHACGRLPLPPSFISRDLSRALLRAGVAAVATG